MFAAQVGSLIRAHRALMLNRRHEAEISALYATVAQLTARFPFWRSSDPLTPAHLRRILGALEERAGGDTPEGVQGFSAKPTPP